jgi:hypothetical protein
MRTLIFVSRIAFLCNLLFVVSLIARRVENIFTNHNVNSFIIILGWLASFPLNIIVNVWIVIFLLQKKQDTYPKWLFTTNALFFLFQMFYHFLLD